MKRFSLYCAGLMVALASMLLTSCSKDTDNLLSTVPADAQMVAVADLDAIANGLGVKVEEGGEVSLPQSWQKVAKVIPQKVLSDFAQAKEAIDLSNVVVFITNDGLSVATFLITDQDKFEKIMDTTSATSVGGYKAYTLDGHQCIYTSGNQAWFYDYLDAPADLDKMRKQAADKNIGSIASLDGVRMGLDVASPLRVAYNIGRALDSDSQAGRWAVVKFTLEDKVIGANAQIMTADGKPVPFEGLQTISTDFLRYTPANASFVAAIGATPQTDWSLVQSLIAGIPDPQISGLIGTVFPYLKKADGTVALAIDIDVDDLAASGSTFLFMIHMPQAEVDNALNEVAQKIESMGITPSRNAQGVITIPGLYAGNVDGYLAISSRPFNPTENNSFNQYFLSRQASMLMTLPNIPMLDIDTQVTLDFQVETQSINATLRSATPITDLVGHLFSFML